MEFYVFLKEYKKNLSISAMAPVDARVDMKSILLELLLEMIKVWIEWITSLQPLIWGRGIYIYKIWYYFFVTSIF